LTRYVRNQVLFAPSFFKAVSYFPDESQLLTSGTDRKVGYWEAFDGSLIRELEASQSDTINGLDITTNGKFFAIGGSDKLVKVIYIIHIDVFELIHEIYRYTVMKREMLHMLVLDIPLIS
jgi:WD40 repeat protein